MAEEAPPAADAVPEDPPAAPAAAPGSDEEDPPSRTASASRPAEEEEQWPTSADLYTLDAEIGFGAFATVYRATCADVHGAGARECAIKIIDLEELNVNWEETRREISIMRGLKHPNVVPVLQAFVEEQELWVVMPLLDGGSCAGMIKEVHKKGIKDDAVLARVLLEALRGLSYLHANGHIHRDVKASNILVSGAGTVMIADFGVAGTLMEPGDRKTGRTTFTGTPCWMAPEVMEQRAYDYKADIWSFGITALELAYGRAPYAHYQPMKVLMLTLQEPPPTAAIYKDSHKHSSKLASLVEKCLRKDPAKRPTAAKLMEHKFFRKAADDKALIEYLVAPMPAPGHDAKPIPRRKKDRQDQSKRNKPVSVGSWVFNPADMAAIAAEMKAEEAAEEEAAEAGAGAGAAAGGEEEDAAGREAAAGDEDAGGGAAGDDDEDTDAPDAAGKKIGRFTVS